MMMKRKHIRPVNYILEYIAAIVVVSSYYYGDALCRGPVYIHRRLGQILPGKIGEFLGALAALKTSAPRSDPVSGLGQQ